MSLKKKYKVNSKLVADGVWFDVMENTDGTKARVRLRRTGRGNRRWMTAYRDRTQNVDMEAVTAEEDEVITAEIFVEAILVEWVHLQVEEGVDLPYTKAAALELLSDPDWIELLKDWQAKSSGLAEYQDKELQQRLDADAGN